MPYKPIDVAHTLGLSVQTVRNWSRDYGELLSPSARGDQGERLFDDNDLAMMRQIARLRSEGLGRGAIIAQLRQVQEEEPTEPPVVDLAPASQQLPTTATPEAPQLPAPVLEVYLDLAERVRVLEAAQRESKASRYDGVMMFAAGVLAAALFFLLILFLRWLTLAG